MAFFRDLKGGMVGGLAFVLVCVATLRAQETPIDFGRDIRPILSDRCFHCHGPAAEDRQGELRLDRKEDAMADRNGYPAISPGQPEKSELWKRISTADEFERMPPADSNKTLSPQEIQLIKRWIEQGAEWKEHWSYVAPKRPALPKNLSGHHTENAIDLFTQERLHRAGLALNPEADRRSLIRRLSFDLTGLPPTPEAVAAFVNDDSPDAYERLVDRLLESPHFGERMALMWLDAARYGDTSVHHADGPRDMWAWRDRVVRAYNENIPFDRFSILQLAGDLVPGASVDEKTLAGFLRNNGTTDEGGAIAEEYRVKYAVDRVSTTAKVWMGMSLECAQCHEHKYDPLSQEDYYRFYAYFNVSADAGMQTRNGNTAPILNIPDPDKERQLPQVREELKGVQRQLADRRNTARSDYEIWLSKREQAIAQEPLSQMPAGLDLHYPLDAGQGNEVSDAVDANRKGTIRGKADWGEGQFKEGLKLDGKTFVELGDVAAFERSEAVSYGGWLHISPNASGALVARMDNADSFRGFDCLISGGHIEVHLVHKWPDNALKVRTKKKLPGNKWQHVFATYDGSSKASGVTIYVDGEPWETTTERDALSDTIQTPKSFLIGSRHPDSRLTGSVDEIRFYRRKLSANEVKVLAGTDPILPILQLAAADRTPAQKEALYNHFLKQEDKEYRNLLAKESTMKQRETELLKPMTSVMIMSDMPNPRDTFILARGQYDSPTKHKVEAGTPAILSPMPEDFPKNRLGLARWFFLPEHPLTARVAVNRYWQMLFGMGLVNTPGDFGSQGEFPSHPELLDWLAVEFRESQWNIKHMLKLMVMSATYRQSSQVTPEKYRLDPDNRLLARGPRFRLQAEMIRDQALAVSGLLVDDRGGPGVKPYQPPGLWAEVGLGGNPKFKQDQGDKIYRRSLYTYWKRSAPPPNMQIFDAPTREECTLTRPRTNTPLQALVTLNDVQFVEAARHLAERILTEGGQTPTSRIDFASLLVVSRPASDREQTVLRELFQTSFKRYQQQPGEAEKLLAFGDSPRNETLDLAEHAAWTIVAATLLNTDETLTRN